MLNNVADGSSESEPEPMVPPLPSIGRLLGFAAKRATELAERRLAPNELTMQQWVVLSALWRRDGLTIGQIAAYHRATDPTTSSMIGRMEAKGLVERRLDPVDRRQVRVFLTEGGRALGPLLDFYKSINEALTAGFSDTERKTLTTLLERVIVNAGDAAGI